MRQFQFASLRNVWPRNCSQRTAAQVSHGRRAEGALSLGSLRFQVRGDVGAVDEVDVGKEMSGLWQDGVRGRECGSRACLITPRGQQTGQGVKCEQLDLGVVRRPARWQSFRPSDPDRRREWPGRTGPAAVPLRHRLRDTNPATTRPPPARPQDQGTSVRGRAGHWPVRRCGHRRFVTEDGGLVPTSPLSAAEIGHRRRVEPRARPALSARAGPTARR